MIGADVYLWGTRVGAVVQNDSESVARFNYDPSFLQSGIELSPLVMPLSERVYSFSSLSRETFQGLPGMLADSLPDKYGTKLIERYVRDQHRLPEQFTAVEKLCYVGTRGMGALEYQPAMPLEEVERDVDIDRLVQLASEVLKEREDFKTTADSRGMDQLIRVGTSAGGARAKAIIAWNEKTGEIRSGQVEAGSGFDYWIVKFDGVSNNKDKGENEDGPLYTRIEYAYHNMAVAAGITMMPCRLFQESGHYHFLTKRFDRIGDSGDKLHMQSLGGMAHYDFNMPGAYSYEQATDVLYALGLGQDSVEELFRRMVFNVLAMNHDDHVKNISFLMDRRGNWSLSPAYDLTFAFNPSNIWLARHQMSIHGKLENVTMDDLLKCASDCSIKKQTALTIIGEVDSAVARWASFAENAFLPEKAMLEVKGQLNRAELL